MQPTRLTFWSFLATAVLVGTACAPAAPAQPTTAPAAKPTEAPKPAVTTAPAVAASPAASPAAAASPAVAAPAKPVTGQKEFKVGFGSSPGFSHVPMLAAIEELNKRGYKIEPVFFAQSEVGVEAVAKGDVAFGNGSTAEMMVANQKGAPLLMLDERNSNEWTIYSVASIQKCADLDGKRLAVHSTGAVSTRMVNQWLKSTCPEAKPNILTISGSDNRAAALQAGQIDATPLELADGIRLDQTAPGKYRRLTDFASGLPLLSTSAVYVNKNFYEKNPEVVRDVLKEQLLAHRKLTKDLTLWRGYVEKNLKEIDKTTLDAVMKGYNDIKGFDVNGGLTPQKIDFTLQFFTESGDLKPGLKASDVSDMAPLNDVLKDIGKQ